jgi:hypothetical protein
VNDAQKNAAAAAALKWFVTKALESQKQKTAKWRVKKTSRGWAVFPPGTLWPKGVYPTHKAAIAAIQKGA